MELTSSDRILVTGATGLVGSHVVERAHEMGIPTRTIVRPSSDTSLLDAWNVETVVGDLTDPDILNQACANVTAVVHCAAKVGDWGPIEDYRRVNVDALQNLLDAAAETPSFRRFIHISSLGVYEARDHYGTDEFEPPCTAGIDGYTVTKAQAELLVREWIRESDFPAVILRPGFIYGPRDRTVLPRLLGKLKSGAVKFLGTGEQLMNNTSVHNLVDAIFQAFDRDDVLGECFNVTDGRLVSKREFMRVIAEAAGYPVPARSVPLPLARVLASLMESTWRLLKKQEAPLLSSARIKFLGLNLDFCIDKAKAELGYEPQVEFAAGMQEAIDWCREQGVV